MGWNYDEMNCGDGGRGIPCYPCQPARDLPPEIQWDRDLMFGGVRRRIGCGVGARQRVRLLADAKAGEYPPQQVLMCELACDLAERSLSQPQFFGGKFG